MRTRLLLGLGCSLGLIWTFVPVRSASAQDQAAQPKDVGVTQGNEGNSPRALKYKIGDRADAGEGAPRFDHSDTFVPPDRLPIVDRPASLADLGDGGEDPNTGVAVTPDGKVETIKPRDADAAAFREMLRRLEAGRSIGENNGEDEQVLRPESVIGPDTRTQITNTTAYPYRTAGRIDIGCTGTLIGPRHVLTAGHCVFNIANNQWYSQLNFSPGQNGATRPYGTITWKRALSTTGWTRDHNRNYDYAMIILNQDIGNTVGTMGFGYNDSLPMYNININGFPGDKPTGTMWHSFGAIKKLETFRIYHDSDTFGGNSGSAVYVFQSQNNSRTIYGIHAYGVDSTGFNGATRINKTVYDNLKRWISEN